MAATLSGADKARLWAPICIPLAAAGLYPTRWAKGHRLYLYLCPTAVSISCIYTSSLLAALLVQLMSIDHSAGYKLSLCAATGGGGK